jgi:hypothetical protein
MRSLPGSGPPSTKGSHRTKRTDGMSVQRMVAQYCRSHMSARPMHRAHAHARAHKRSQRLGIVIRHAEALRKIGAGTVQCAIATSVGRTKTTISLV